jgi:hypothetical protein
MQPVGERQCPGGRCGKHDLIEIQLMI